MAKPGKMSFPSGDDRGVILAHAGQTLMEVTFDPGPDNQGVLDILDVESAGPDNETIKQRRGVRPQLDAQGLSRDHRTWAHPGGHKPEPNRLVIAAARGPQTLSGLVTWVFEEAEPAPVPVPVRDHLRAARDQLAKLVVDHPNDPRYSDALRDLEAVFRHLGDAP